MFFYLCLSISRLLENATDTFSYYLDGLSPYTQYLFRVVVSHKHGQTAGPWATLCTAEDSKYTCTHTQVKMNQLVIHRCMHLHMVLLHTMLKSKREKLAANNHEINDYLLQKLYC